MRSVGIAGAQLGLVGPALSQVHLNELSISHSGTDALEFIELIGVPGTLLDGVVGCVVEGDGLAAGTLDRAYDLTGKAIPAGGCCVPGDTAVTPNDFVLGNSVALENGSETFYVIAIASVAAITSLEGTNLVVSGTSTPHPGPQRRGLRQSVQCGLSQRGRGLIRQRISPTQQAADFGTAAERAGCQDAERHVASSSCAPHHRAMGSVLF